jgi:polysaccharide biosynthesis transport protein
MMKKFESLTVEDYISIIRRRIWYVVGVTFVVSVATFHYVRQIKPTYLSETTMSMAGRLVPENYVDSIARETNPERMEFVRDQVQSRTFVEQIARDLQLVPPGATEVGPVVDSVKSRIVLTPISNSTFRLSFTANDPVLAQKVTTRLAERVILLNTLLRKAKVEGTDHFLDAQLEQASAELAKSEESLRQFYNRHFPGIPRDGINLDSLTTVQAQLSVADGNLQTLLDKRKELERRIEEQTQLKSVARASAPRPRDVPAVREAPIAGTNASPFESALARKKDELAEKLTKYTPMHPTIIALTQDIRRLEAQVTAERERMASSAVPRPADSRQHSETPQIVLPEIETSELVLAELQQGLQQVKKDVAAAEEAKQRLVSKTAVYQSRINPPAELAIQLNALNRAYENARVQYTDVSLRKNRSGLASQADTNEDNEIFRIIDKANLPRYSSSPSRRMLAMGGCLAGLLLGIGAAFWREFTDSRLYDEDQAATQLKMPILASLPEVPTTRKNKGRMGGSNGTQLLDLSPDASHNGSFQLQNAQSLIREVLGNHSTIAGEQFRLLRAKLSGIQKSTGLKSLIVTSAIPNEGKTFSATCLAGIMAQEAGKKVLLIDADLRTSNAGTMLGVGRGKFGLSDYLREVDSDGGALLGKSVVRAGDSNWYFLSAGTVVKNPGELLSSPEFTALIRLAQNEYDWIIVDSPPILVLADTNSIADVCHATLLVACAGKTSGSLVKDAVARLGSEHICGVVMNRVRHLKANQYYRSYYKKQAAG